MAPHLTVASKVRIIALHKTGVSVKTVRTGQCFCKDNPVLVSKEIVSSSQEASQEGKNHRADDGQKVTVCTALS